MMHPTNQDRIEALRSKIEKVKLGGGADKIEALHKAGKLSARERIDLLADEGTFEETFMFARHRQTAFGMDKKEFPADGVVTGSVRVDGRPLQVASQDSTVAGGALGEVHGDKITEMMKLSLKTASPFIFLNDSGGARIQEGIDSLASYARVFYHNVLLSGFVPQVAVICGACAGGAAYSPALCDFVIQSRKGQMFLTGPAVIEQITGEVITSNELGGADVQMEKAGNVHLIAEDDAHAIALCKRLLSYLPSNNAEDPPVIGGDYSVAYDDFLNTVIPEEAKRGFNVKDVIGRLVDGGDFLELQESFAANAVVGFGRICGYSVGIVANQPIVMAGCLSIDAADKIARFVRFCNAFNVPLVTLVDVPGFIPGVSQEHGGVLRHGAKMLFAYSAATVPKITIMMRKSYGGAYVAMCAKDLGADRVAAWPTCEIAVMGAEGAVSVIYKREIDNAEDKDAKRDELMRQYRDAFSSPYMAAGRRLLDTIIEPGETRAYLAANLKTLNTKRELRPSKKHGLIPL